MAMTIIFSVLSVIIIFGTGISVGIRSVVKDFSGYVKKFDARNIYNDTESVFNYFKWWDSNHKRDGECWVALLLFGIIIVAGTIIGGWNNMRKKMIDDYRSGKIVEQVEYTYRNIDGIDVKMNESRTYVINKTK